MNPDDLKKNLDNSKGANDDLNDPYDSYSEEMNQYLSDAVSDSFNITSNNKKSVDDEFNPPDPFGLGSDDTFKLNLDEIPGFEPSSDLLSDSIVEEESSSDFIPPTPDEISQEDDFDPLDPLASNKEDDDIKSSLSDDTQEDDSYNLMDLDNDNSEDEEESTFIPPVPDEISSDDDFENLSIDDMQMNNSTSASDEVSDKELDNIPDSTLNDDTIQEDISETVQSEDSNLLENDSIVSEEALDNNVDAVENVLESDVDVAENIPESNANVTESISVNDVDVIDNIPESNVDVTESIPEDNTNVIDDIQENSIDANDTFLDNSVDTTDNVLENGIDFSPDAELNNAFDDSFLSSDTNVDEMSPVVDLNSGDYQETVQNVNDYNTYQEPVQDLNDYNAYQEPVQNVNDYNAYQEPVQDQNNMYQEPVQGADNQVMDFDSSLGEIVPDLNEEQLLQGDLSNQSYNDPNVNGVNDYSNYDVNGVNNGYDMNGYNNYDPNNYNGYDPNSYDPNAYNVNNNGYDVNNYNNGVDVNNYNNGFDANNYNNSSFNEPNFTAPEQNATPNLGNVGGTLNAPNSVKEPKKVKTKKGGFGKVLIIFLVLALIGGVAYGGYYLYSNYLAKANLTLKNKFFTSIANSNVLDIAPDSQIMDTLVKVLDESHTSKLDLTIDSDMDFVTNISTKQGVDLNKLKLVLETIVNKENNKSQLTVKANYANNDIATYEEIINKDYTAIKLHDVTEKYLATSEFGTRTQKIMAPTQVISNYLPTNKDALLKLRNSTEELTITDEEIKNIAKKYLSVIADQFVDDQFTQTENIKLQGVDGQVSRIKLTVNENQLNNIYKNLLEEVLKDNSLLALVASTEEDNTIKTNVFEATNTEVPSLVFNQNENNGQTQEQEVAPVEGQATTLQAQAPSVDMQPVSTDDNIVTGTYSNDDIVSTFTTSQDPNSLTILEQAEKQVEEQSVNSLTDETEDADNYSTTTDLEAYSNARLSDIIVAIYSRYKSKYTIEELIAGLKSEINLISNSADNREYEILLYESDNKVRRLELNYAGSKITIDFSYGEKNTLKFTILSSKFDSLGETVNSVIDNINLNIPSMTESILDVDESSLPASTTSTTTTTTAQTDSQNPNTAPSLPTFSNTVDPQGNVVDTSNTNVVNNTTTNTNADANQSNTVDNQNNTTATQGNTTALNAGIDENGNMLTNTATMNDERVSSAILDMMPEEEPNNTPTDSTVAVEPTNGFSFIVEKVSTDFTSKYNLEFDFIENNSINNKIRLETTTNGKASSKEVKNIFKFTYNNKAKHFSVAINYNIAFDISKLSIPDFTTENAIFIDKLSDTEIANLEKEIETNTAKLIVQMKKSLNIIDDKNTPVEVEQPIIQQVDSSSTRITQEEAQTILVDSIGKYMGDVMARGETFTLNNLETFTLPDHEFSCVVNGEIAIIEIDGYRFHLDSAFNLSAE